VESIADGKLMLKLASGTTVTFTLDGSTTYHQSTTAAASDVAAGDQVNVRVDGGRFGGGGNGATGGGGAGGSAAPGASGAPSLTARDVTVVK